MLYSRLNDEVVKTFIMNENTRRRNMSITIMKLDCSPSLLKYEMILRLFVVNTSVVMNNNTIYVSIARNHSILN